MKPLRRIDNASQITEHQNQFRRTVAEVQEWLSRKGTFYVLLSDPCTISPCSEDYFAGEVIEEARIGKMMTETPGAKNVIEHVDGNIEPAPGYGAILSPGTTISCTLRNTSDEDENVMVGYYLKVFEPKES